MSLSLMNVTSKKIQPPARRNSLQSGNKSVLSCIDLNSYAVTDVYAFEQTSGVTVENLDQILVNMLSHETEVEAAEVGELVNIALRHRVDIKKSRVLPHLANYFIQEELSHEETVNTKQQLSSNIKNWVNWCMDNGMLSFPASSESIITFLDAHRDDLKVATLKSYIWALRRLHVAGGLPDPTKSKKVEKVIDNVILYRQVNHSDAPVQTQPLRKEHLKALYQSFIIKSEIKRSALDVRNILIIFLSYDTLLRESELARVAIEDVLTNDEKTLIRVTVTKSSKGKEQLRAISDISVELLEMYLELTGRTRASRGPLFLKHTKSGRLSKTSANIVNRANRKIDHRKRSETKKKEFHSNEFLTPTTIYNVFLKASDELIKLGWEPSAVMLSGHSGRVGRAKDLRAAGVDTKDIQAAGGWNSLDMVAHYTKDDDHTLSVLINEQKETSKYITGK